MQNYNIQEMEADKDKVIENIKNIDAEVQEEIDKGDEYDKDKVFKLRYKQMIQGLYLNQIGINNYK